MKIVDNPANTVGISYWRTPRLLLIDLGRRSLQIAFALALAFAFAAPLTAQQPAHAKPGVSHNTRHRSNRPMPSRALHGHHADYAKPLDALWVCPGCHAAVDPRYGGKARREA